MIGLSPEALDRYIVGNDPDTGKPVIDEIIEVLTKPISQKKSQPESPVTVEAGPPQVLLEPDTEDNLQRLFYKRGWTVGLPVILPTEERVQKMLAGTNAAPDEVVSESFSFATREMIQ